MSKSGLGIRSLVFERLTCFFVSEREEKQFAHEKEQSAPTLFCHERPEQIAHSSSFVKSNVCDSQSLFVKSDRRKSLKSLFKKEEMRKESQEHFALLHLKGEKLPKKGYNIVDVPRGEQTGHHGMVSTDLAS